jgi:hypothetical protein
MHIIYHDKATAIFNKSYVFTKNLWLFFQTVYNNSSNKNGDDDNRSNLLSI